MAEIFHGFQIVPRVSILASLYHYREIVPNEWLDGLGERTVDHLVAVEELGTGGGSDLEYAIDLATVVGLPDALRERLTDKILQDLPRLTVRDPDRWSEYCMTPLRAAPTPDAPGADLIRDSLVEHLDYMIETQSADGSWDPTWTWGDGDPEGWEDAKREWQGVLTLETLTSLRAYGRLD